MDLFSKTYLKNLIKLFFFWRSVKIFWNQSESLEQNQLKYVSFIWQRALFLLSGDFFDKSLQTKVMKQNEKKLLKKTIGYEVMIID